MSILTKESIAESEIILNKTNIALARSRALIQSWMKAPLAETTDQDDEDDFKPEIETAGIGSTAQQDDSVAATARSRQAAGDKLLEQILGKKAAQAHRKAKAATQSQVKGGPTSQSTTTIPATAVDVEDEEESRVAAVGGRAKKGKAHASSDQATPVDETATISSRKRKPNSFMDELLSKKAKKKSRQAG